jgi:hypothetical protein
VIGNSIYATLSRNGPTANDFGAIRFETIRMTTKMLIKTSRYRYCLGGTVLIAISST